MLPVGVVRAAINKAESGDFDIHKLGAVVFKASRIYGSGCNERRYNSKFPSWAIPQEDTIHAELAAIADSSPSDISGSSMLVVRIGKKGELKMARPCEYCAASLQHFGVNKVYYSNRKGEIVMERVRDLVAQRRIE